MIQAESETLSAGARFQLGDLDGAIEAANAAVRRAPADLGARFLLAEFLVFASNFTRADAVLDAAGAADPGAAIPVAEFRQLVRAAMTRAQVLGEGRVPEFLDGAAPSGAQLRALLALREGDLAGAARAADEAEAERPAARASVTAGETTSAVADFRDACDLWGGTAEVLTVTGRYFWIPFSRIAAMVFHPARRPRDLAWRRCTMTVADGPDGDVYMPALYFAPDAAEDSLRLGRATTWRETAPVTGSGQRLFLAGDEGVPVLSLDAVRFG